MLSLLFPMSILYIRVPPIIKSEVEKAAKEVGISVNLWVQRLLEKALLHKNNETTLEWYEGKLLPVINGDRTGWWRYHDHYDRDGYCDNPGRGY